MRNLAELMASDPDLDALSTSDLFVLAVGPNRVTDRARALLALSRLVGDDALSAGRVLGMMDRNDMGDRVMGLMTVRLFGLVGLLVNSNGEARSAALEVWNSLVDYERQDVRSAMSGNGVVFPW
jgi:hypothetical protein